MYIGHATILILIADDEVMAACRGIRDSVTSTNNRIIAERVL